MKFLTPHMDLILVIVPETTTYDQRNMKRRNHDGLRVYFRAGWLDTLQHQKDYRWSDDDLRYVENGLLNHKDFNTQNGFFLAPGETIPEWFEGRDDGREVTQHAIIPTGLPIGVESETCVYTTHTQDGSVVCGEPSKVGPFCAPHAALTGWESDPAGGAVHSDRIEQLEQAK